MVGHTYNRLTVDRIVHAANPGRYFAECTCACGWHSRPLASHVLLGLSRSCGCLTREIARVSHTTHGATRVGAVSPIFRIWAKMNARCYSEKATQYRYYGGRGITVCNRWRGSFQNFANDVGPRPSPQHTIDRIDNDGNYEPSNVRWATRSEQNSNTRRNRFLDHNGERMTLAAWSRRVGITAETISKRLKRGWSLEKALQELPPSASM